MEFLQLLSPGRASTDHPAMFLKRCEAELIEHRRQDYDARSRTTHIDEEATSHETTLSY